MKTIIAPVDFSDVSANALSFAAELSQRDAARLIIVNVIQKEENEEEAGNKLNSIESGLKNSFGPDLLCESVIAEGNFIAAIEKLVAEQSPDLIVMGTKGAGVLKRILIGSNTVNVIAKIAMPVLVIPEEAKFKNFIRTGKNRIILATDLDTLENEETLNMLKEIALLVIEPKIDVLSVRPKNTELSESKRTERDFLLSFFNPEIETKRTTVFSSDVLSGINFYLDKKVRDTGLVAMIARDSGQLFEKHYTREMASYTDLPLLVLPDIKN